MAGLSLRAIFSKILKDFLQCEYNHEIRAVRMAERKTIAQIVETFMFLLDFVLQICIQLTLKNS